MATRYCGTLKLKVTYRDATDDYRVAITEINDDARFPPQVGIRLSPFDRARVAVDSRKAYDKVAHAAISFCGATEDGAHIYNYVESNTDSGDSVIRRKL